MKKTILLVVSLVIAINIIISGSCQSELSASQNEFHIDLARGESESFSFELINIGNTTIEGSLMFPANDRELRLPEGRILTNTQIDLKPGETIICEVTVYASDDDLIQETTIHIILETYDPYNITVVTNIHINVQGDYLAFALSTSILIGVFSLVMHRNYKKS